MNISFLVAEYNGDRDCDTRKEGNVFCMTEGITECCTNCKDPNKQSNDNTSRKYDCIQKRTLKNRRTQMLGRIMNN